MKYFSVILAGITLSQQSYSQVDIYYSDAYSLEEKCAREAEQYEPEREARSLAPEFEEQDNSEGENTDTAPDYHDAYQSCLESNSIDP